MDKPCRRIDDSLVNTRRVIHIGGKMGKEVRTLLETTHDKDISEEDLQDATYIAAPELDYLPFAVL